MSGEEKPPVVQEPPRVKLKDSEMANRLVPRPPVMPSIEDKSGDPVGDVNETWWFEVKANGLTEKVLIDLYCKIGSVLIKCAESGAVVLEVTSHSQPETLLKAVLPSVGVPPPDVEGFGMGERAADQISRLGDYIRANHSPGYELHKGGVIDVVIGMLKTYQIEARRRFEQRLDELPANDRWLRFFTDLMPHALDVATKSAGISGLKLVTGSSKIADAATGLASDLATSMLEQIAKRREAVSNPGSAS